MTKIMKSLKQFQLPSYHMTPHAKPFLRPTHPKKLNVLAQISWVVRGKAGVQTSLASAAPAQGHTKIVVMGGILVRLFF